MASLPNDTKRELMHVVASLMVAENEGDTWEALQDICRIIGEEPPDWDRYHAADDDDDAPSEFDRFFEA